MEYSEHSHLSHTINPPHNSRQTNASYNSRAKLIFQIYRFQ